MLPVNVGSVKDLISQKEKVTNNDARLILREKLNGATTLQVNPDNSLAECVNL